MVIPVIFADLHRDLKYFIVKGENKYKMMLKHDVYFENELNVLFNCLHFMSLASNQPYFQIIIINIEI